MFNRTRSADVSIPALETISDHQLDSVIGGNWIGEHDSYDPDSTSQLTSPGEFGTAVDDNTSISM
jgi:hypothetical protein